MITEFANPANLLVGISETDDPLGSFFVYSFSTPEFPDYPKYGIWNNAYVVTTNEGGAGTLHQYFIDRDSLVAGAEEVTIQRVAINGNNNTEAGFYVTTPVDWNGATAPPDSLPMVVKINDSSWGEVAQDVVEIYSFDVDFSNSSNTTVNLTSIITTPFDGFPCAVLEGGDFPCIPQKDGVGLDGIPEVIMNVPHYRNFGTHEAMVLNFITDATNGENISGIRWMELRRSMGSDWTLYQEGTLAPDDSLHRFMGSIAMDGNGNIGLAYNVSGENDFTGIRFTGRFADDPLGVMTVEETEVVAGQNVINSGTRFGDYAQMNVDPVDDMTFWYTSEYAGNGTDDATTRIFSFQLERRTNDLAATNLIAPSKFAVLSNAESITAEINNTGNTPVSNVDIQLFLDDVLVVTDNISTTINPREVVQHTFSQTVDLSTAGVYEISYNIVFTNDEANQNNFLASMVNSIHSLDAGVSSEIVNQTCMDSLVAQVIISNNGGDTLTALAIDPQVNGSSQEIINWTGSLRTNESETIEVIFSNFASGQNTLALVISNPNGGVDQNTGDNEFSANIDFLETSEQVTFDLITDNFPEETTWQITDSIGQVVIEGGPYLEGATNFVEQICLERDGCYTFSIFDSANDGICCGMFGDGSYSLIGTDGVPIFESSGEFGDSEETNFCLALTCNLAVELSSVDASSTDFGSISIEASGGFDYAYSIDGGATFTGSSFLNNLEPGTYDVVVTSNFGSCQFFETIEIGLTLSLNEVDENFKVWPNPSTDGIFRFSYENETIQGFLEVEVLNADGKVLQYRKFSRYDESFEGTISLLDYSEGIYYIRMANGGGNKMKRLLKR